MSIVFVILSSLLFGIHPSIQNMAMLKGADVTSVLFSGSLVAVIGSFLLCILNKSDLKASKKELFYFFLAGLMIPGCVWNAAPRSLSPLERNVGFWTQA